MIDYHPQASFSAKLLWECIQRFSKLSRVDWPKLQLPCDMAYMPSSSGVACIEKGIPLNLVQRWLGHARLTTTAIYADAVGEEERHIARPPLDLEWVGSGRVTLRHVSPIPPLDPYVRLSPHTAHERGILWDMSISPAPRSIHRGQLCAFAGYLCTVSLPSPSGPSPCARLSRAPTTMPYLTACRASEFRMGLPTSYSPPSLTSLAGSPVFTTEDSSKTM